MRTIDVNEAIDGSPLGRFQWTVVALSALLLIVDGYDVFVAGTVLPTLIAEWGLTKPDANIDHRRVLNLETFLARQNARISLPARRAFGGDGFDDPQVGDVLTWRLSGGGRPHLGVVVESDQRVRVAHNIGDGVREEALWMFKLHKPAGHYRWRV